MKRICLVCQNIDCKARGSEPLTVELQKRVAAKGLDDDTNAHLRETVARIERALTASRETGF